MNLKAFRTQIQMTQDALALSLGVSQQTVARWEKGTSPIKHQHVREMCVLFGCTADELLGFESDEFDETPSLFANALDYECLFGSVRINTESGMYEYPVGVEAMRKQTHVLDSYHGVHSSSERPNWLHIWTLNNRGAFINTDAIKSVEYIDDNEEAAPMPAHPEVWRAISEGLGRSEVGDVIAATCRDIISGYGEETAHDLASSIKVVYVDGSVETHYFGEEHSSLAFSLEGDCGRNRLSGMWPLGNQDREVFVNSKSILLWEYPLEMHWRLMED